EFKQCQWDNLPNHLLRGDIDIVVNGYELTSERLGTMTATIPYYIYELQLLARRDDPSIRSWDDLTAAAGRQTVRLLGGSAAEKYVAENLGGAVEVRPYTGTTEVLQEVQIGRLDATVQDLPPAIFYRNRFPELQFVGGPVGRGYYVIYLRKGDDR